MIFPKFKPGDVLRAKSSGDWEVIQIITHKNDDESHVFDFYQYVVIEDSILPEHVGMLSQANANWIERAYTLLKTVKYNQIWNQLNG